MKSRIRTFVAVQISAETRRRAGNLIERLRAAGADVKWVAPENLHLTLKFLGDVDAQEIPDVCRAIQTALADRAPFEFEVRGAGAFPKPDRPRTVWLGVTEGQDDLIAMNDRLEKPLAKLGFRRENRAFTPHLTIGRVRGGGPNVAALAELIGKNADFDARRTEVSEAVVFASHLDRSGPTYEPLARAQLAGG